MPTFNLCTDQIHPVNAVVIHKAGSFNSSFTRAGEDCKTRHDQESFSYFPCTAPTQIQEPDNAGEPPFGCTQCAPGLRYMCKSGKLLGVYDFVSFCLGVWTSFPCL